MFNPELNTIGSSHFVLEATWQVYAFGFLGGCLSDLLAYVEYRTKKMPEYFKTWRFWLGAIILANIGAILAISYGTRMEMRLAINLGMSAPFVVKASATAVRRLSTPNID